MSNNFTFCKICDFLVMSPALTISRLTLNGLVECLISLSLRKKQPFLENVIQKDILDIISARALP